MFWRAVFFPTRYTGGGIVSSLVSGGQRQMIANTLSGVKIDSLNM